MRKNWIFVGPTIEIHKKIIFLVVSSIICMIEPPTKTVTDAKTVTEKNEVEKMIIYESLSFHIEHLLYNWSIITY